MCISHMTAASAATRSLPTMQRLRDTCTSVTGRYWQAFPGAHQFCRVGAHSFLGMYAGVNRDVPAYTMVGGQPPAPKGINSEGLKRRGFSREQIRNIKNAYRIVFRSGQKLAAATEEIAALAREQPELDIFLESLRLSERGILR